MRFCYPGLAVAVGEQETRELSVLMVIADEALY
jgi:hypothetical protein